MTRPSSAAVVAAIRSVVGSSPAVPLHVPEIDEVDKHFVDDCLESTFVSSVGPFVTRFEDEVAAFTGASHAVAVSNGTAAIQVALTLVGVGPGDEVLVPALSFVATANAVVHAGGTPHFVDSAEDTLGMDPAALETVLRELVGSPGTLTNPSTGARVRAIVPMHTLGHPADIAAIVALGEQYGIPVVEDAAESLGSFADGRHTGTAGVAGTLSFNGNKIVTTGGGGMILTDDDDLARRAKHLTTTAKVSHRWEFDHDEVGWNYRMPNINAALGVAQLSKLGGFLRRKRVLAGRYAEAFAGVGGVTFLAEPNSTVSNYWLCAVRLDVPDVGLRNEILDSANADGLQCRPFWKLLSTLRMYADHPSGDLENARALHDSVICLPSSPALAE